MGDVRKPVHVSQTPADTYRAFSQRLSALADLAAGSGYWRDTDPSHTVGFYSVFLLKSVFMIDTDFSLRDHSFVNAVFHSDNSFEQNLAMARRAFARAPRPPTGQC